MRRQLGLFRGDAAWCRMTKASIPAAGGNFLDRAQDTLYGAKAARAGIPTEVAERLNALEQETGASADQ